MSFTDFQIKTFLAKDGVELKYVDVGEGRPMVYVYGFGSSIESQTPFIEAMQGRGRVIVFDQRAFGMSPAAGEMGVHQSARDAKAIIEHLGLENVVLYGYSMGAAVCFSFVWQFGTAGLSKIILGDMSPKLINEDGWKLGLYQGWYTRGMFEEDLRLINSDYKRFALILSEGLLYPKNPEDPRDFTGTSDEIRARILERRNDLIAQVLLKGMVDINEEHIRANYHYWETMAGSDFRDVLPKIDVPTALLYADPGSGYCPATAEYIGTQVPNIQLFPMYGCTHMAASESPSQWRGTVAKFAFG